MKNKIGILVVAVFLAVVVAGGLYSMNLSRASASMTQGEFSVNSVTCGSCAGKIGAALQGVAGVGPVEVDVQARKARVSFDPQTIAPERIASLISAAGYPAVFLGSGAAASVPQAADTPFVARIGSRLVLKKDFEEQLLRRVAGTPAEANPELLGQIRSRVWEELLQRELMLGSAESNGVQVTEAEVEQRIAQLSAAQPGFEAMIAKRYGNLDNFRQVIREDMAITRNIEQHVLSGETDTRSRQVKLDLWYRDLMKNTPVEIYDPRLKATKAGGCGGCC